MRQRHRYEDEPCTLTVDYVVKLLEGAGYERSADLVRRLGNDARDKNQLEEKWRLKYVALLERLHIYEPPTKPSDGGGWGKPGPMSDG
jgi:hypothetical protein